MKHKTSELSGDLLDAAVAKACGLTWRVIYSRGLYGSKEGWTCIVDRDDSIGVGGGDFNPSTRWEDGGPIIDRERIDVAAPDEFSDDERWFAGIYHGTARHASPRNCEMRGDTPLIAAMRAFVASKLGEEVDL